MQYGTVRTLRDAELVERMKLRLTDERASQAVFLALLGEMDARKLYAELGYSSLFVYCTQALRLSEGSAYRRIHAARAARQFPAIYALIASGEIHCAAVSMIRPHLTEANASDLLGQIGRKSKREIEELIAGLAPQADAKDVIRTLPVIRHATCPGARCTQVAEPPITNQTMKSLVGDGVDSATRRDDITPLAPARIKFQFTASEEFREKFDRARSLLWHKCPDGKLEDLFEEALDALLKQKDPVRKGNRAVSISHSPGRYIPAQVKRSIWQRDHGQCQFVGPYGKRCGEKRGLEYDHVQPFALGGRSDDPDNIRLLCRTHNQWRAARMP